MKGRFDKLRWEQLSPLLDELLALEAPARAERLDEIRRGHPAVADDLADLLSQHADIEREAFLEGGLLRPAAGATLEGQTIGSYTIDRLIGEGGMSRVYLASREKDDEPLVVKILRSGITQDKRQLARFIEEYNLVERIRSPHVARIYGHGVSESHAYLVMEFFDGGDLNKRLGDKPMPPEEALRIFRELMLAMDGKDALTAGILKLEACKRWLPGTQEGFEDLVKALREKAGKK